MTVRALREKYLGFFASKGHGLHASGSLVPFDVTGRLDESLLFNGAGMVQFKPYFRGVATPPSKRLVTAQKCLRTGDIEEVGDLTHLTFFEMLGNFSFGDYFKAEAIAYSWEFLTSPEWLGLDPTRLSFTVFEEDEEAFGEWSKHLSAAGIDPATRVFRLGEKTNYWPAGAFSSGPPGPCGPNSEMFYWTGEGDPPTGTYSAEDYLRDEGAGLWLEIWNDVFIQYEWQGALKDASRPDKGWEKTGMPELPFRSVDTGMGIERTVAVLSGKRSVYDTDAFTAIFAMLSELSGGRLVYGLTDKEDVAMRIVADHLRAACFCIADGVLPSNTGRGYVLRRLIRRAVLKGARTLGFEEPFLYLAAQAVVAEFGGHYRELVDQSAVVTESLRNEEIQFRRTLEEGAIWLERKFDMITASWRQSFRTLKLLDWMQLNIDGNVQVLLLEGYSKRDHSHSILGDNDLTYGNNLGRVYTLLVGLIQEHSAYIRNQIGSETYDKEFFSFLELVPKISGEEAFQLYDTFGFPLEVTQEIAAEAGVEVDVEGFREAMLAAQERSRASNGMETVYGGVQIVFQTKDGGATATETLFYDSDEAEATVVGAVPLPDGDGGEGPLEFVVALDRTPFYAESGGQVADTGRLTGAGIELRVKDVTKQGGVFVHLVEAVQLPKLGAMQGLSGEALQEKLNEVLFGQTVSAAVDTERRRSITRNHTATHLMHAALREVLGKHVTQAGSLVAPDHLRFDFTHGSAMSAEEVSRVEEIVYGEILKAQPVVVYPDRSIDEARAMGAMMLFGEKYGDRVRVVQIGGMAASEPSFSRELCGGIHVANTGEIGLFKIQHEASAASGVRRITAVTGMDAFGYVRGLEERVQEAAGRLKSTPGDLVGAIEKLQEALREERKKREKLAQQGAGASAVETIEVGGVVLKVQKMEGADPADVKLVADRLVDGSPLVVALVANVADGKVTFACKVGAEALAAGAKAGELVREVATVAGGGGGGRPDFATAGGRDASKVDEALARARVVLGG